jgi:hypothetical protein
MPYHSPYSLLEFGTEGELWEVIALEVTSDGRKIHHFFLIKSGPISGVTELTVAFQHAFQLPLQLYQVYL